MRDNAAAAILDLALARPPTLGRGRLVCLDGPAGSGKTTLAGALTALVPTATVVHIDDLLEGWDGLATVGTRLDGLLGPLSQGRPGRYRRWDWYADGWAEEVTVDPVDLLVLEGVGSGSWRVDDLTVLVWIEASYDVRMGRGLARDGDAFAPHWEAWARAEADHFAQHRTRERADLVLDGSD